MFGKPDWFRPKTIGWGLTPVRWQGWAYTAAWMGVIGLPFVAFALGERPVEACTWLAFTIGGLVYDVRGVLKQMQRANFGETAVAAPAGAKESDVLYIGDSSAGHTPLATRNYSFKLK